LAAQQSMADNPLICMRVCLTAWLIVCLPVCLFACLSAYTVNRPSA